MRRKLFLFAMTAAAIAAMAVPAAFAARAIQGAVGDVTNADGVALGQVGFRTWSARTGGDTGINQNTATCLNIRCLKAWVSNTNLGAGGYVGNQEATNAYNLDSQNDPFYELVDADMNDASGNHIAFWGVAGIAANNNGQGQFLSAGCPSTNAQNCFQRLDNNFAQPALTNTFNSYPAGGHTTRAIGGLNPVPNVKAKVGGTCATGQACLSWTDPPTYANAMRVNTDGTPAPPSPVKGVHLYRFDQAAAGCPQPAGNDPGWASVGTFALGANTTTDPLPAASGTPICRFYALTVRVVGPGGGSNEVETGIQGASRFVGMNSQPISNSPTAVRIVRAAARYEGRGSVGISWQSGLEGDVQGYYVNRGVSVNGPFTRVSDMIAPIGDNSPYSYNDKVTPSMGHVLYYQVETVTKDGTKFDSSPIAVMLPLRTKKPVSDISGR